MPSSTIMIMSYDNYIHMFCNKMGSKMTTFIQSNALSIKHTFFPQLCINLKLGLDSRQLCQCHWRRQRWHHYNLRCPLSYPTYIICNRGATECLTLFLTKTDWNYNFTRFIYHRWISSNYWYQKSKSIWKRRVIWINISLLLANVVHN